MDTSQSDLDAIRRLLADLTTRVYRIERKLEMDAQAAQPPQPVSTPAEKVSSSTEHVGTAAPSRPAVQSAAVPPSGPAAPPPPTAQASQPEIDLESRIGSHWLNRIGITAVLIGISYFLKFAFDNNWIGPAGRVTIGLVAGIAIVLWSERFRNRGYKAFSYSLKAVGIGALYLSLWAAFQVYSLIPGGVAFVMMLAVTAATAAMSIAQDAQILAAFALAGGFSTPLLLSAGQNRELALFSYVALLDVATLVLVAFKPWRRLLVMSYAGTLLLYIGWYSEFYTRPQLGLTLAFATIFFAMFAIAPLVTLQPEGELAVFASIPAVLAFVNAGVYFLQAYAMIDEVDKTYMAWFAVALAAVYIALSRLVHARNLSPGTSDILYFLHLAVAIGFITIAIPIRLNAHWITIGWFIEAGVLLWVANRIQSEFLNVFALGALALGVFRLLAFDNFRSTQLIFNMRMATYAVAVAVLAAVAWYASQRDDDSAQWITAVALVSLNVLALIAFTREVSDYFTWQMNPYRPSAGTHWQAAWNDLRRVQIERDFTYSALWMAYGAMLMIVGFVRSSAFVRWQALVLIAVTIAKVFVYDVSELDRAYRIISFIVLGALLLAISFVYQRDWLKLSAKNRVQTNPQGARSQ
ncbi:MAG TPA: DUF2339 domain-containing protein [Candidatus Sulfotelmatobacter sp.]|nr:DUF2339 domain-containing protein [Candidatus Sulfotelmatobacter sp.]